MKSSRLPRPAFQLSASLPWLIGAWLIGSWLIVGIFATQSARAEDPPAAKAEQPRPTLRVLTYNIHHGEGMDGRLGLERIAKVINSVQPDLVALQEVDSGAERTKQTDQPAVLAELTKLQVVFGDNIPYQGGRYGNAVLSRFPIERHENHPLPSHYQAEQRGVLEVIVRTPAGWPRVRLLATHLDYRPNSTERLASAKVLNKLAQSEFDGLTLLAGDLNSQPASPTLRELEKHWRPANKRPAPTFPVVLPTRQIDHVLLNRESGWRTVEFRVLNEAVASDHRAALAVLTAR